MAQRRSVGRPTREEAAEIADAVLDAARAFFCAAGFAEVSMDRIAQQLKASKLTIYSRFGSKEGLLIAVVDRDIARLRDLMTGAVALDASPMASLEAVSLRLYEHIVDPTNLAFRRFLQSEAPKRPVIRERWGEWTDIIVTPMLDLIRDACEQGQISAELDPRDLADILLDLLDGVAERLRDDHASVSEADRKRFFSMRWGAFRTIATSQS